MIMGCSTTNRNGNGIILFGQFEIIIGSILIIGIIKYTSMIIVNRNIGTRSSVLLKLPASSVDGDIIVISRCHLRQGGGRKQDKD